MEIERDFYAINPKNENDLCAIFIQSFPHEQKESLKEAIHYMLDLKLRENSNKKYLLEEKYFQKYIQELKKYKYSYKTFTDELCSIAIILPLEFMKLLPIIDDIDIITNQDIINL
jgi:hypothetical protein